MTEEQCVEELRVLAEEWLGLNDPELSTTDRYRREEELRTREYRTRLLLDAFRLSRETEMGVAAIAANRAIAVSEAAREALSVHAREVNQMLADTKREHYRLMLEVMREGFRLIATAIRERP